MQPAFPLCIPSIFRISGFVGITGFRLGLVEIFLRLLIHSAGFRRPKSCLGEVEMLH